MDRQTARTNEFRTKKWEFEEKEELIRFKREQGIYELTEIADQVQYYLKDYVSEPELMLQALTHLESMKATIYEAAQHDSRQLEREIEALEADYYYQLRRLAVENLPKKESDDTC